MRCFLSLLFLALSGVLNAYAGFDAAGQPQNELAAIAGCLCLCIAIGVPIIALDRDISR